MLHTQWGLRKAAVGLRLSEDQEACDILGAACVYLPIPDCIYRRSKDDRRPFYASETAIFGFPDPEEEPLIGDLAEKFSAVLPKNGRLVCPLAIGGHVDHRLTRAAAELLEVPLWYYADYPYVELDSRWLSGLPGEGDVAEWTSRLFSVSGDDLTCWQQAVAAYRSQWPTFWADEESMAAALAGYQQRFGGVLLWKKSHGS
jgi:hypothetical protein